MTAPDRPGDRRTRSAPVLAKSGRKRLQRFGQRQRPAPDAGCGQATRGPETSRDPGCYEARHRFLTRSMAISLAAGLILIAGGIFLVLVAGPLPSRRAFKLVAFPACAGVLLVLSYVLYVILLAGRVAFRADEAGITFPATPCAKWMLWSLFAESQPEFIRWSHVKGITLYTKRGKGLLARFKTPLIEVWHPRDAHHTITRRSITTWRLDLARLAAIAAAAAPGIAITESERV